jgi:hypothetical protein
MVQGDANLIPENIAEGENIFGVIGSFKGGEDVSAELTEQDDIIALMQEAIATKSAAGVADPFAVIGVTYPEGSTCTCTDGIKELTAKDTSGQAIFVIPYAGTWTITTTDGTDTASETVEITKEGESVTINLSYDLLLFSHGDVFADVTGGWTSDNFYYYDSSYKKYTPTISDTILCETKEGGYYSIAGTAKKIDLTNVDILYVNVLGSDGGQVAVSNSYNIYNYQAAKTLVGYEVNALDVRSLTGEYYITIATISSSSNTSTIVTVDEIWGASNENLY